jgi:phosphoserine phosphatase
MLTQFAADLGLYFDLKEAPTTDLGEHTGICVTILGDEQVSSALERVTACLLAEGLRVTAIRALALQPLAGLELLAHGSHELSRADLSRIRERILTLGPTLAVDLAVQSDDIFRTSRRLVCMDVDSTFVRGEFIDDLADLLDKKEEVAKITGRAMRGEIEFEEALRERVRLLRGLPMTRAKELCERFELTAGALELVRTARKLGMRVGLVSGGFDFFVDMLKDRFQLDFAFANALEVENGVLTGEVTGTVVDCQRKAQVLLDMSQVFGIRLEQTIAIGDGANDIEMLKVAGLGIAYQAKPRLRAVADTCFIQNERLDGLFYLMGYDARKLVEGLGS